MHPFVFFDGQIVPANSAFISAAAPAALYGRGVFTTVRIAGGAPFLWEKHRARLNDNAAKLKIDLSAYPDEAVESALFEIIKKNSFENGRARITFFDEAPGDIWNFERGKTEKTTSLLIATAAARKISGDFRLTVSPFRINSASPLAGLKSCNYLEKILALDEARARGFDEAVRTNERGEAASACMANIFWLAQGKLFTAPIASGALAGTTRAFLLEKFDCTEAAAELRTLKNADAIFLTSAGIGVVRVSEFEGRVFNAKPDEVTQIVSSVT